MAWLLSICEGRPFDTMVRAAELALALAEKINVQVVFEKEDAYSPWRHLLSSVQQVRLRALAADPKDSRRYVLQGLVDQSDILRNDRNASMQTWRNAVTELQVNYLQLISCRTGEGVPSHPPASTWLVLLGDSDIADPGILDRYERIFSFGPCPTDQPVVLLPRAISTEHFAPGDHLPPRDAVLLIGHGDLRSDCRVADWLVQGGARVTLLDPYHCEADYRDLLPRGVTYADPRPPAARHACYVQHSAVVVARDACSVDNHFLWEAIYCGLTPLNLYVPDAAGWSPALFGMAIRAHLGGQAHAAPPRPVAWNALLPYFEPATAALRPTASKNSMVYAFTPHRVFLFRDVKHAARQAVRATAGARSVAALQPHGDAKWEPAWATYLRNYQQIYVDTSENTDFLVGALTDLYSVPVEAHDNLLGLMQSLLKSSTPQCIDIIHVDPNGTPPYSTKRMLDGLYGRFVGAGITAQVPRVLLHQPKPYKSGSISKHRIGVSVATEAIVEGLLADAEGRFQITWLSKQGFTTERGRTYFYPFHGRVGFDLDELDYGGLPKAFAQDQIDLLCCIDPFLAGGVSARTLWARKAVPLVGMLHSVHSANGATEAIFNLLNGPSLPCDTIIAPSRCGADAYQGLFDAAAEWIARFSPHRPRFQGRIEVIPYGIEAAHYQGLHSASCREALGLPADGIVLLSFGRFNRQEKCDLLPLLLAVRALRREHPRARLLLAGARSSENYADALRNMLAELRLQDVVHIYDDVDGRDKLLIYGAADVFVSISDNIQETYGLTLLEAMAAGLPLVASAWDGYREIVRHEETGFLVPTSMARMPTACEQIQRISEGPGGYGHRDLHESVVVDPFALTHYLGLLAQNVELRHRMGQTGKRLCKSEYDLLKQARKTGDCLLERWREAQHLAWPVASPLTPFFDPVGKRFATYPSAGFVDDHMRVTLSPWGADAAWSAQVRSLLDIHSRQEQALMEAMLSTVANNGPLSIADLAARLQSPLYSADEIKPRVVRCVKYGFLQRVDT